MVFFHFCAAVGVAPMRLQVPAEARALLNDTAAYAREHGVFLAVDAAA